MSSAPSNDKQPTRDPAEDNAFFPSPFSLSQFTSPKSDLSDAEYPDAYTGGRWKVLVLGADERYLPTDNGTLFSTGNHPVETLLPMYHMHQAGFDFDIATLSGNPMKFEYWAMPSDDEVVQGFFAKYREQFMQPKKLSDVIENALGDESDYIAVFIPGGHGALIGLPESAEVKQLLQWARDHEKFTISLCHGPAAFLAAGIGETEQSNIYNGYQICAFPDSIDATTPDIGYMPGHLTWAFGAALTDLGIKIVNSDISGQVLRDRDVLTGDSPMAGNALGKLAAETLLEAVSGR